MRRPRHPVGPELKRLTYNSKSALYEIEELGILYSIPLEHTRLLKDFSRAGNFPAGEALIASWYKSLSKSDKKKVIRTGNIPVPPDGFYPDPQYD